MRTSRYCRLLIVLAVALGGSRLPAQVVRLPAVMPPDQGYPGQLTSHVDSAAQILQEPGSAELPAQPERPPDARPGMFQKLILAGGWLAGGGDDGFGLSTLELSSVLALPVPSREYPLIITPGFAVHYLDGPEGVDLPPRVYDAYTQFRWRCRVAPRLGVDLAVAPGMFGDFQHSGDENFRITGHAVGAWEWTPAAKIVLGAAYIDRFSTDVLPVCGLVWTPHDAVKYELVFPNPRIARRVFLFGACTEDVQDWVYLAGELGGGTWAVQRDTALLERIDYTDYRLFLGMERKVLGGLDTRLEVGYVFGRRIRFEGPTEEIEPADTFMLRGGVTY